MKILVPIKRVVDYRVKIRVKSDGTGVVTEHVKMSMNPFDEIAIEEAVRLKEKKLADEIIAISIGDALSQETLRTALAMGADRAVLIQTDQALLPRAVAKILEKIIAEQKPELVMMGKQAIDGDYNQTGQMLAARLQWGIGTFISKIEIADKTVTVVREVDTGLETLQLTLPCVVTVDLRLNQPRIATLPNIMQAKQKPLEIVPLANLGLDLTAQTQTLSVEPPVMRQGGKILANIDELVKVLKQEKIIS
ncbi:MAG: electron transfer flavoprotein subunit beta/FixA family protein [Legionellales bacterium]|jgi:electron transfer flavoprotein beta subunit